MIKFPRVHIAASVVNRILNTRDELERGAPKIPEAELTPPPAVPDPALVGAVLDAKIHTPPADLPPLETPPPPADDELAGIVARGDNLISA